MYRSNKIYPSELINKDLYLKYKFKYLNLRKQSGGAIYIDKTIDKCEIIKFIEFEEIPDKIIITKTTYIVDNNSIHIVKIVLNQDDKPVLFVVAGISHKSFLGTSHIILNKLTELGTKFKEIYLVEYDSFKDNQNEACINRDKIKIKSKDIDKIYNPELEMNDQIANYLNNIITNILQLTNVHLLGKCNGAWIITLLLLKNPIYKGLYLAVPGIPFNIDILDQLRDDRLEEINFIFGWLKQDGYLFNWGRKSNQEKKYYDETIEDIKGKRLTIKYKSIEYDNGEKEDPKKYHELYPGMIDDIISTL
jgi:hypothetical protein